MIRVTQFDKEISITEAEFSPGKKWLVNGAILEGRDFSVVWDTAAYPKDMTTMRNHLSEKPAIAIYSHADWDHCWGTCGFDFNHIIAHANAVQRFNDELPGTLRQFRNDHPNDWRGVKLVSPDFTFDEAMTLSMGLFTLKLYSFQGHTKDSIVGYIPEKGLFLAGDSVEAVPVINDPADVRPWLSNLEKWMGRTDVQHVLPGHGNLFDTSIFAANHSYLKSLLDGNSPTCPSGTEFYKQVHLDNCKKMEVAVA